MSDSVILTGLPTNSTQDFRSHSVDSNRERSIKAKWSPKWAACGIPTVKIGPNDTQRPHKLQSSKARAKDRRGQEREVRRVQNQRKRPALKDDTNSPDCSSDDDHIRGDDNLVLDDIKYSYDAPRGPASGEEILEIALKQAVLRYEDQETTKLVNNEYEVVDDHNEASLPVQLVVDDDFELV